MEGPDAQAEGNILALRVAMVKEEESSVSGDNVFADLVSDSDSENARKRTRVEVERGVEINPPPTRTRTPPSGSPKRPQGAAPGGSEIQVSCQINVPTATNQKTRGSPRKTGNLPAYPGGGLPENDRRVAPEDYPGRRHVRVRKPSAQSPTVPILPSDEAPLVVQFPTEGGPSVGGRLPGSPPMSNPHLGNLSGEAWPRSHLTGRHVPPKNRDALDAPDLPVAVRGAATLHCVSGPAPVDPGESARGIFFPADRTSEIVPGHRTEDRSLMMTQTPVVHTTFMKARDPPCAASFGRRENEAPALLRKKNGLSTRGSRSACVEHSGEN